MEYKKNDIVTVGIDDIGNDGEGIGRVDGYTLFVKDAVIGDVVEARITKCKKNHGYARLEKVVTPSSFRVKPRCAFYRRCGGCQIQAMNYERQLTYKQDKVRNNLVRLGGFRPEEIDMCIEPIIGMKEPWHYRNKAQFPVGYDKYDNLITGFYAGRTHDIIANTDCMLGAPENKMILEAVLGYMRENGVTAYREKSGQGLVRHVLIRTGFQTGEIMVCLVINGKRLPKEHRLAEKLTKLSAVIGTGKKDVPARKIVSISININEENTNVIMGNEVRVLWGTEQIHDILGGLDFTISPLSFYQVNPLQAEKLYSVALAYTGLTGKEVVWDLYCGIGTISLFLAKKARQVYGVEMVPQAIDDARENARRNGITNVDFFVGKVEEVLPEFYGQAKKEGNEAEDLCACQSGIRQGGVPDKPLEPERRVSGEDGSSSKLHPDVIVVDPPRKGCDEKCLETMLKMQPERIVYVSCDSATLARDLKMLCAGGYEIKRVRAVDMFGQSGHVETVVLMSRVKA